MSLIEKTLSRLLESGVYDLEKIALALSVEPQSEFMNLVYLTVLFSVAVNPSSPTPLDSVLNEVAPCLFFISNEKLARLASDVEEFEEAETSKEVLRAFGIVEAKTMIDTEYGENRNDAMEDVVDLCDCNEQERQTLVHALQILNNRNMAACAV